MAAALSYQPARTWDELCGRMSPANNAALDQLAADAPPFPPRTAEVIGRVVAQAAEEIQTRRASCAA
ncbi:hypothetical protein ACIBI3_02155 [Actinomadura luteofluorescens]|uniref:hypothetical protein n=1 Tax=Actinomadura luteofluorescens TaxID=46163 RepID=UPI00347A2538